jgi:hypothetical protein
LTQLNDTRGWIQAISLALTMNDGRDGPTF